MSNDPVILGMEAVRQLQNLVAIRFFDAAPRVNAWSVTLADAFTAHFDGDPDRLIELPENATTPDGDTVDRAYRIIEAFDNWLGHDAVTNIIEFVEEENQ
jgi:hypothetical protein